MIWYGTVCVLSIKDTALFLSPRLEVRQHFCESTIEGNNTLTPYLASCTILCAWWYTTTTSNTPNTQLIMLVEMRCSKLDCQQRKKQGGCISCQTAFYEYEESLKIWDKTASVRCTPIIQVVLIMA